MIARFEAAAVRERCRTTTLYSLLLAWILITSGAIFLIEWCLWLFLLDLAVLSSSLSLFLLITGTLKVAQWFSEEAPLTFTILVAFHEKGKRVQIREREAYYTPVPQHDSHSSASSFLYHPQHEQYPHQ